MEDFTGVLAVFMSLAIPIAVIVFSSWVAVVKKRQEKEIRQLIIENDIDIERAKLLISEPEVKSRNKYGYLRRGLMFVGIGIGASVCFLAGIDYHDVYFWIILAVGMGAGMLASFFIEMKLSEKEQAAKED